jgi:hypothetical protein
MSEENKRNSSHQTRPPGITNEEYQDLEKELREIFREYTDEHFFGSSGKLKPGDSLSKMLSHFNTLENEIRERIHTYFLDIPSKENMFVDEDYIKATYLSPTSDELIKQKARCNVCKENRSVDKSHIIPSNFLKSFNHKTQRELLQGLGNFLILCPNHHRFFDRGRLSKVEWDKIDFSDKHPLANSFSEKVLYERQKIFWETDKSVSDLVIQFFSPPSPDILKNYWLEYRIKFDLKQDLEDYIKDFENYKKLMDDINFSSPLALWWKSVGIDPKEALNQL